MTEMVTDTNPCAIALADVRFAYGDRVALQGVSLQVRAGEVFAFLGPNGGGKTTLFRLLSTLIPPQAGELRVLGFDLRAEVRELRRQLGVVFQAPSLDGKLTVAENLKYQAALFGIRGREFRRRSGELLDRMGLSDRANDYVEELSGGLKRRAELAKGLLHQPKLLLLDEPTTALDPGARADLWKYLEELRQNQGVTVVLTTHLLEEAERADRIAILDRGAVVAIGAPDDLKATVGGDTITLETANPERVKQLLESQLQLQPQIVDHTVRLELPRAHEWVPRIAEIVGNELRSLSVGKPTLEDVFIDRTGHRFRDRSDESTVAAEEL